MAPLSKTARETLVIALANAKIGKEIADSIDASEVDPLSLRKDGTNSPTANIPWGGFKITGLGAPTLAGDAATKSYVDASVGTAALKLDGSNSPTAAIDWGNQDLSNIKDVTINGDLTVNGTTTTIDTVNLLVEDKNITVNHGGNDFSSIGAGLTVERVSTYGSLIFDPALASKWKAGLLGSESELLTVATGAPVSEPLSLHVNGDNSPTSDIPWGGFGITNLSFLEVGTSPAKYRLLSTNGGLQLIAQDNQAYNGMATYGSLRDGSQTVGYFAYSKGNLDYTGANEYVGMLWDAANTQFIFQTYSFGAGSVQRPLVLTAGGSFDQVKLNIDGSTTFRGAVGNQPYTFGRRTGALDRMTLQGGTAGLSSGLEIFSADGLTTSGSYFRAFGLGTPASITNSEHLFMGWDQSVSAYLLTANRAGTGVQRPLRIGNTANSDMLTFNTDGSLGLRPVSMTQTYKVTKDTLTPSKLAIQGQSAGVSSVIGLYANDGDTTDNVSILLYGLGTPAASTNSEFLEMNWSAANSRYQIVANKSGTGTVRNLALGTLNNPTQILLDAATPKVTIATGPLVVRNTTMTPNGSNDVGFLNTVSGSAFFNYFGTPGDTTQAVILGVHGLGTSGADANREGVRLQWDNTNLEYSLHTIFAGTGVARPLSLYTRQTGGTENLGQLKLNIDGTSTFSTGAVRHTNGTAALPSISFTSETNTGVYRPAAGEFAISVLGTQRLKISNVTENGLSGTTGIDYSSPVSASYRLSGEYDAMWLRPLSAPAFGAGFLLQPFATDGTEGTGITICGKWDPTGVGPQEYLQFGWEVFSGENVFVIQTARYGGVDRPLKIRTGIDGNTDTGANQNQLVLNIDGTINASGQFRAASLGVGNSVAATVPGAVTKKIEVFDAAGTSLGFVAVYASIT